MTAAQTFRQTFGHFDKNYLRWFPGHMNKGLKQMQSKIRHVDCVIEVHDARIPLSGRNVNFRHTVLGVRPHILLLNKCDLTDMSRQKEIQERLKKEERLTEVIFTNCKTTVGTGVSDILPTVVEVMKDAERYNRSNEKDFTLLVIGVPNVGKSSFINALRSRYTKKGRATPVGPVAGVTRSVLNKICVSYNPRVFLLDSPGILEPSVTNIDAALRLALCASMQDHLVGRVHIADYLLYWLNKNGHFGYVENFGLDGPIDNITEMLAVTASKKQWYYKVCDHNAGQMVLRPDLEKAATFVLETFRRGDLGKFLLDSDLLDRYR